MCFEEDGFDYSIWRFDVYLLDDELSRCRWEYLYTSRSALEAAGMLTHLRQQ